MEYFSVIVMALASFGIPTALIWHYIVKTEYIRFRRIREVIEYIEQHPEEFRKVPHMDILLHMKEGMPLFQDRMLSISTYGGKYNESVFICESAGQFATSTNKKILARAKALFDNIQDIGCKQEQ